MATIHSFQTTYAIAAVTLLLFTAVFASVVLWCAVRLALPDGDLERTWLLLYKATIASFALAVVLSFLGLLLSVVVEQLFHANGESHVTPRTEIASHQFHNIGSLFDELAVILALLTLLALAACIRAAHVPGHMAAYRMLHLTTYGLAAVLVALDVASFVLMEGGYQVDSVGSDTENHQLQVARQFWFIMLIIQLAFAVAVMAASIIIAVETKLEPKAKAMRYYLACCVLMLLRTSYDCGFYARYVPLEYVSGSEKEPGRTKGPGPYFIVLDIVFGVWPLFAILILLFDLGIRTQYGVRATSQQSLTVCPGGQGMFQRMSWCCDDASAGQHQQHPAYLHPRELPVSPPELPAHPLELNASPRPCELSPQHP